MEETKMKEISFGLGNTFLLKLKNNFKKWGICFYYSILHIFWSIIFNYIQKPIKNTIVSLDGENQMKTKQNIGNQSNVIHIWL